MIVENFLDTCSTTIKIDYLLRWRENETKKRVYKASLHLNSVEK